MSRQHHALAALGGFVVLGLAACQVASTGAGAPPAAAPVPTAAPTPSVPTSDAPAPPAPSASASAAPPATSASGSATGLLLRPAPAGAPAVEREAVVLGLIRKGQVSQLPQRAADGDLELDPDHQTRILARMHPEPGVVHAAKVRMGDFTVNGSLPNEIVKRIFRQNLGRVRLCYEKQLEKKPTLEGKMKLEFTITPQGDIQAPRGSALTLNEPALFDCIAKSTKDITFPQPEGGPVTVSVPISFAP